MRYLVPEGVAYVPPAAGDAAETFLEAAVEQYRKRGPRTTLRGGVTLADLEAVEAAPFELTRKRPLVRVLGIVIGGKR